MDFFDPTDIRNYTTFSQSPFYQGGNSKSTGDDFDVNKYKHQSNPKALFIISIIGMLFLHSTVFFEVFCAMFVITTIYGVVQYWQSKKTSFKTQPTPINNDKQDENKTTNELQNTTK